MMRAVNTPMSEDRAAIVRDFHARRAELRPVQRRGLGLLLVGTALLTFFGGPAMVRALGLGSVGWVRPMLLVGSALLLLLGFVLSQTRFLPYDPEALVAAAVTALAGATGEPATRRGHAVTLLCLALDEDGPTARAGYDAARVARALGVGLNEVRAIERVLVDEAALGAVFTSLDPVAFEAQRADAAR